jgi:hypothetical protein
VSKTKDRTKEAILALRDKLQIVVNTAKSDGLDWETIFGEVNAIKLNLEYVQVTCIANAYKTHLPPDAAPSEDKKE